MATLNDVLTSVAAYINQDPTIPTGSELTMWVDLVNQSQEEWADVIQWRQLRVPTSFPSTYPGQTSIGLPVNFKKLMTPVYDQGKSVSNPDIYDEINPDERYRKLSTDKYVCVVGNDVTGYGLIINPGLPSLASLSCDIQVNPSSLATLNHVATCPDKQFLVARTLAKILSARSDTRFPSMYQESNDHMGHMIDDENARYYGTHAQTPTYGQTVGFRIGE
jgi:hypothetical protein